MNRRNCLLAGAALATVNLGAAFAQNPAGTLTIVVPYAAGGASDVFARAIAPTLGQELGRTIVVENISGASGSIAATKVLAERDVGASLLMASPTDVILAPLLLKSVRYKAEDFQLLGLMDKAPLTMFVRADLPVQNVDQLIAHARRPGAAPLSYGTTGPGSVYHLAIESLRRQTNVPMTHVPYRGGAPMLQDLMAGNIDMVMLPASITFASMAKAGKIRAIAVAGPRSSRMPEVQSFAESKTVSGYTAPEMWAGLMAPARTPAESVQKMHAALSRTLAKPDVRAALEGASAGGVPATLSLSQTSVFYKDQVQAITELAKAANVEAQ